MKTNTFRTLTVLLQVGQQKEGLCQANQPFQLIFYSLAIS